MTSPAEALAAAAAAFAAALALAFASAVVERAAAARASGLRRPRLLGPAADAVKVMARTGRAAPGSGAAAFAALLPALALASFLPRGAGVGGLLPPGVAAAGGPVHALLLLALLAASVHAWLLPAAFVEARRRQPLVDAAACLLGCHLAALLVVSGLLMDRPEYESWAARPQPPPAGRCGPIPPGPRPGSVCSPSSAAAPDRSWADAAPACARAPVRPRSGCPCPGTCSWGPSPCSPSTSSAAACRPRPAGRRRRPG